MKGFVIICTECGSAETVMELDEEVIRFFCDKCQNSKTSYLDEEWEETEKEGKIWVN